MTSQKPHFSILKQNHKYQQSLTAYATENKNKKYSCQIVHDVKQPVNIRKVTTAFFPQANDSHIRTTANNNIKYSATEEKDGE